MPRLNDTNWLTGVLFKYYFFLGLQIGKFAVKAVLDNV